MLAPDPVAILLLDGGTGRELKRIGAPFAQPEWSAKALLEAPHFVTRVHEAYVAAGADVITTNSYALVPFHIGAQRFRQRGAELAALAGRLARNVANQAQRPVAVAGSLPPIGGSYRAELFDANAARPILATLVDALRPSIDHWQAETLSLIAEAHLVRDVVGEDGKPLWLSFTLADDRSSTQTARLRSGEAAAGAVAAAIGLKAAAVLFNCSQPEVMGAAVTSVAQVLRDRGIAAGAMRIGVYANAFPPLGAAAEANADLNEIRADMQPNAYLGWARDWVARGANIIGGCCGIGPEHIAALRAGL